MTRAQNFQTSTIYHIRHAVTREVIYVGSSTAFARRVHKHKSTCNNPTSGGHHFPVYQYIRDNGGWDAYHVVPVSHHNLQNKVELQILEQQEIDRHTTLKNAHFAKRSKAEYYQDNIVAIAENKAQYYQTNAVALTEYHKQYRHINAAAIAEQKSTKVRCACGCMCSLQNIAAHRKTARHLKWMADSDYEVFKLVPLFQ